MNGSTTGFVERPDGRLACTVIGEGPLVVCSPSLGDLRSTYTYLADDLASAGFKVISVDLRGHGDSSVGWQSYSADDVADDLLAVARAHDADTVTLLGNGFSGGAAVIAAGKAPELVAGVILSGAVVRDVQLGAAERAMMRLANLPRLGQTLWMSYWPKLFGFEKPANFEQRRQELAENMAEPGRFAAAREMLRSSRAAAEKALSQVSCPTLVLMGDHDPDFRDPAVEAQNTATRLGGPATVVMVPGAGHYPHTEDMETVAPVVIDFLRTVAPARS
ncbi:alpha/beta hydrolase [Amycolatopsis coloradensis]|uniref:Alpha/beta hydrolase n=1 Tax=Amycolatopsis coloradensis TaxID=76021 RepID=A0ACD5BPI3_9PSEU